jgi:hypothetical protein
LTIPDRSSVESPNGPVIKVMDAPAGWMPKSIHLDSGEIDDEPIDFGARTRDESASRREEHPYPIVREPGDPSPHWTNGVNRA